MNPTKVVRTRRSARAKSIPVVLPTPPARPSETQRRAMVSEAAYYRAQKRGFEPGWELDDWLAAEAEIDACSLVRDLQPELH